MNGGRLKPKKGKKEALWLKVKKKELGKSKYKR